MNGLRNQLGRLLPSTMFGRLAASLVLVVVTLLAVMLALILRDRAELSMRVGGVGDSSHRIAYLTRELEALDGAAPDPIHRHLVAVPQPVPELRNERSPDGRDLVPVQRSSRVAIRLDSQ